MNQYRGDGGVLVVNRCVCLHRFGMTHQVDAAILHHAGNRAGALCNEAALPERRFVRPQFSRRGFADHHCVRFDRPKYSPLQERQAHHGEVGWIDGIHVELLGRNALDPGTPERDNGGDCGRIDSGYLP